MRIGERVTVADVPEPTAARGYRIFYVLSAPRGEVALYGATGRMWETGKYVAQCDVFYRDPDAARCEAVHSVAQHYLGCDCGVYHLLSPRAVRSAVVQERSQPLALGANVGWGWVALHEHGFRATHSRIEHLSISPAVVTALGRDPTAELMKRYGVPVEIRDLEELIASLPELPRPAQEEIAADVPVAGRGWWQRAVEHALRSRHGCPSPERLLSGRAARFLLSYRRSFQSLIARAVAAGDVYVHIPGPHGGSWSARHYLRKPGAEDLPRLQAAAQRRAAQLERAR